MAEQTTKQMHETVKAFRVATLGDKDANKPIHEPDAEVYRAGEDEMHTPILPTEKYMDERLTALRLEATTVPLDRRPSVRMWGIMEGQRRQKGFFRKLE